MVKTNQKKVADYKARQAAKGLVRVEGWVKAKNKAAAKAALEKFK